MCTINVKNQATTTRKLGLLRMVGANWPLWRLSITRICSLIKTLSSSWCKDTIRAALQLNTHLLSLMGAVISRFETPLWTLQSPRNACLPAISTITDRAGQWHSQIVSIQGRHRKSAQVKARWRLAPRRVKQALRWTQLIVKVKFRHSLMSRVSSSCRQVGSIRARLTR